jgi:hypothetical protein
MTALAASRRAVALALLGFAVLVAPAARAQDGTPTPSAGELWQDYPLDQDATPTPDATPSLAGARTVAASPTPDTPRRQAVSTRGWGGRGIALLLMVLAAAIALVTLAVVLLGSRTRRRIPAPARAPSLPPDPERSWIAEIEWRAYGDIARFAVVARDRPSSDGVVLASSAPLDWPPSAPEAVRAMSLAAGRLAARFIAAGWSPVPAGEAWYAKRFSWEPATARTDRFRRAGVRAVETDQVWRCEIEWAAGFESPRFQAVMHAPGDPQGRLIGASRAFGAAEVDGSQPGATTHRPEFQQLVSALEAAGWRRVGRGSAWYSERFTWPGEGLPPDQLEPLPAAAEPASSRASS